MQYRTWSFNPGLFRKNIRRFWPIWIAFTIFWIILIPYCLPGLLTSVSTKAALGDSVANLITSRIGKCGIIAMVSGGLCSAASFSYLFSLRYSVAMHSLPLRRECVFITSYLSGVFMMVLPLTLNFIVTLCVEAGLGVVELSHILMWFAAQLMADLFCYSLGVLCVFLCGNGWVFPVLYCFLGALGTLVDSAVTMLSDNLLYNFVEFSQFDTLMNWLSPFYIMYFEIRQQTRYTSDTAVQYYISGWPQLVSYLLCSLIIAAIALILCRHRKVELTSEAMAYHAVGAVLSYVGTLLIAVFSGSILLMLVNADPQESWIMTGIYILLMAAGGLLGWYVIRAVLEKGLRVTNWRGFFICFAVVAVAAVAMKADSFGFESWTPNISAVRSVSVECNLYGGNSYENEVTLTDTESIAQAISFQQSMIDHREEAQLAEDLQASDYDVVDYDNTGTAYVTLTYTMKSGIVHIRSYNVYLSVDSLKEGNMPDSELMKLINTDGYKQELLNGVTELVDKNIVQVYLSTYKTFGGQTISGDVTLTGAEAKKLCEALVSDASKVMKSESNYLLSGQAPDDFYYDSSINITYRTDNLTPQEDNYYESHGYYISDDDIAYLTSMITSDWTNTIAVLEDLGVVTANFRLEPRGAADLTNAWYEFDVSTGTYSEY